MNDIVDKANQTYQYWLDKQIGNRKIPAPANNITECRDCGDPISQARKQAVPHAVRCIECQTIYEKRGK